MLDCSIHVGDDLVGVNPYGTGDLLNRVRYIVRYRRQRDLVPCAVVRVLDVLHDSVIDVYASLVVDQRDGRMELYSQKRIFWVLLRKVYHAALVAAYRHRALCDLL